MGFNQPDLFRFTLSIDGVNHVVKNAPDNWRSQSFEMSRDPQFFGVLKRFVTDLDFVLNEAKLLRQKFYTSGIDGEASLKIEKLDSSTWQYNEIYSADIDFSTIEDSIHRIKTNLIDGGLTAKLQAYKNVKYEFGFDESDPEINLGGVDVLEWANLVAASFTNMGSSNMAYYFPSTQLVNYSLVLGGIETRDQNLLDGALTYDYTTGDNCFLVANNINTTIRIRGYIVVNAQQEANNGWEVQIRDSSMPNGFRILELFSTLSPDPQQYVNKRYEFDGLFNVVSGRKYFLTVESILPQNFAVNFCDIIASEIKLDYTQVSDDVTIKAKRPKKLLMELLDLMNVDEDNFVTSNLLDENQNMFVTSGDAIRALPEAKIQTNFNDFFKSFHSILCAGISIYNNTMTFEKVAHFYNNDNQIGSFGNVKNVKFMPYTEVMHSSLKIGYEKQDYEIERGREEFNQGQEWSTPIVRTQTTLDLISPYRADQYGIDELRIKQIAIDANAKDTDTSTDNDVFIIHSEINPNEDGIYRPIRASDLEVVSGVSPRSTAYNFLLSPKRNLLRYSDLLKSMFYGANDDGFVKFRSADKNADLQTKEFGQPIVVENEDIDINLISNRLYLPIICEFDAPYHSSLIDMIDLHINGYFSFFYEGKEYKGFLLNADMLAAKGGQTTFKVILTKDNILT